MFPLRSRLVPPLTVAAGLTLMALAAPAGAQTPPPGIPATGPPPGFGGTLVADPAFGGGGGGSGGGGGGVGQPPDPKLKLTAASGRRGPALRLRIACSVSGKATVRTYRKNKKLGAKRFTCANGRSSVKVRFRGRLARRLARRSRWVLRTVLVAGAERRSYKVTTHNPRPARAAAGQYWSGAKGRCGTFAPTGFGYGLDPPAIATTRPGGDYGRVRYYWYRYGVGWVGDTGWGAPFYIPDESPGAVVQTGETYSMEPGSGAWYAGAIAIWWQYENYVDWNWVPTHSENAYNPVIDNTWCSSG